MVRVVHISDSHLGCSMFQLAERREDSRRCFRKAIDMAMRHKPDVIVHTGDLFDSPDPAPEDLNTALEAFRGIKDQVEVFVLQGNHDLHYGFRRGISPIRTLEAAGVVKGTGDKVYARHVIDVDGESVEIHLISWTRMEEVTRLAHSIRPSEETALLFCHDIPDDREKMPPDFDYIGFGHGHNFWLDEELRMGRPGSTCVVDWKKELEGKKKLIVIDISDAGNKYLTETLNDVREFKLVRGLNITGMGPDEANGFLRKKIAELSVRKMTSPIVIIEVNGMVDAETDNSIRRAELLEHGLKTLDPLFLHIEPNWRCLGARPVVLREPLNVERSVADYMEQTGETDSQSLLSLLREIEEGSAN
ncbi:MAG: metallophosphoesterase [Candidatus Thorarchaeota archaeon]|nr:metallophosphoesterase [Candidatus Thorarchaeota archaeon]